ncbi:unnamed protein product [Closterium sp. Naga37s-1]|nr:unnamed protein product [Closterium sp. Naga37s-1]
MGQVYGLMLEATVKTNVAAQAGAAMFVKRTELLLAKDKPAFLAEVKAILVKRWDKQLHNPLHALGWLLNPRNQYVGEVREDEEVRSGAEAVIHKGEGLLGSPDARWAAKVLVAGGRQTDAEWWWMYGGEVKALQSLAVMNLSQPVTSSEVERYWSAIARVQRRDRNRISAKKMTDVTYVAFMRRARDTFDRKQKVREKLYADLSNGTLKEGSVVAPAEEVVEEEGAEEEGEVNVACTIDWDLFGQIGKKKKKERESSNRKRKGKATKPSKGKKKAAAAREDEEEEAADSSGDEEEEAADSSGDEEEEAADSSGDEEEEAADSSGDEEEEAADSSGDEEEEAADSSGDEEEEEAADSSGDEEEEAADSSGEEEEEEAADSSGDEEEEAADSSGDEEEEAADSSGDEEEEEAADSSGDEEEEAADSSGDEEEEAADSSGDEEEEAADSSGDEEEEAADSGS